MNYFKNPFNYQGGKYKILDQIFPLFPKNIDTFYDIFGGSGEVGLNYADKKRLVYIEKSEGVCNIIKEMQEVPRMFLRHAEKYIEEYGLSKTNKEGFIKARNDYNSGVNTDPILLYCLIVHSFNNQIGFNKKLEFNVPFGLNRSSFNPNLKNNLEGYIELIENTDMEIYNKYFNYAIPDNPNDFLYVDPPYLITTGGYERDFYCKWSEEKENTLLSYLDEMN